jgi:hypothetical protein
MEHRKKIAMGVLLFMLIATLPQTPAIRTSEKLQPANHSFEGVLLGPTKPVSAPSIEIVKPLKGFLYVKDQQKASLKFITFILGKITIEANVTGDAAQRVEFYIDDKLQHTDYGAPYTWVWAELAVFRHTLKVVAYDYNGSSSEQHLPLTVVDIKAPSKQLTRDEAIQILINEVIQPETLDHILYAFAREIPLQQGDRTAPWLPDPLPETIETFPYLVYRESQKPEWFFWIDDVPRALFQHECRFVYIDAVSGAVNVQAEQWWPVLNDASIWNSSKDYWNTDNWAYANDNISGPPQQNYSNCAITTAKETSLPPPPDENGVIVING